MQIQQKRMYYVQIDKYIEVIKRRMEEKGLSELEAVLELTRESGESRDAGFLTLINMAAAVEMIEPSIKEVIIADDRKLAINQGE